jgi:hypothetical protein
MSYQPSGSPLALFGAGGGVDRHGIVSLKIPYWVSNIIDAYSFFPSDLNSLGLPCVGRQIAQSEEGGYKVDFLFDGASDTYTFASDTTTFSLDVTMSDDPIQSHPAFGDTKAAIGIGTKYGWDPIKKEFAQFLPATPQTNPLSGQNQTTANTPNPLYGTQSYLAVGATYEQSFASRSILQSWFLGIGAIVSRPPGIVNFQLPAGAQTRNWLYLAPKIVLRGNVIQVTLRWMMSGPAGWNTDVYSKGQLGG